MKVAAIGFCLVLLFVASGAVKSSSRRELHGFGGDASLDFDFGGFGGGCFPGSSLVLLESGQRVAVRDVRIGDRVASAVGDKFDATPEIVFSDVVAFVDAKVATREPIQYLRLVAEGNELALTPSHRVYAKRGTEFVPLPARTVRVGDVLVMDDGAGASTETEIVAVESFVTNSAFAPVTIEGNVVVDGFVASCYTDIVSHDVAHFGMAPLRAAYRLKEWAGVAHKGSTPQCGWHWYAAALYYTNLWRPISALTTN